MRGVLVVAHLTLAEARRRRVLAAAVALGLAFVAVFAIGLHFIARDLGRGGTSGPTRLVALAAVTIAALYAANFLVVMTSVLVTIDTLSGEIGSGVIEALCTKPRSRATIVLGKWLGCLALLAVYATVLCGGILLVARFVGGFVPPHAGRGALLILFEGAVLLTLALAGGTRLSTLANGVTVFGLFGLAFVGGWVEQIGTYAGNPSARYIGIATSLLVPSESLWQLASYHMQPTLVRDLGFNPFVPVSVPSPAMVAWAGLHVAAMLALAVWSFSRRDL